MNDFAELITLLLVSSWLVIVIGAAFGGVLTNYVENPILIAFISTALGFVYGKNKKNGV